jgi:hypothetical protein
VDPSARPRDNASVRLRWSPWSSLVPALLIASAALGCAPQMKLAVKPNDELNGRRPCYLLVRNVDEKTYQEETYQAAAAKVMTPDDSVLQTAVVFPGTPQTIKLSRPSKGQVALYVFFYRPDGGYKALLPSSTQSFDVVLEGSRLNVAKR